MTSTSGAVARFGLFELDPDRGELRRNGRLVPVQQQSLHVLLALLERPGEEVSRETLRRRLWPDREFLDFENGINTAVARLRQALGDTADNARFIGTRRGHGYRMLVPVTWSTAGGAVPSPQHAALEAVAVVQQAAVVSAAMVMTAADAASRRGRRLRFSSRILVSLIGLAALVAIALVLARGRALDVSAGAASRPVEFDIHAPAPERFTGSFAVSPDGHWLALVGGASPESCIWLRSLDGISARPLPGTEGGVLPFWAPDGASLAFFAAHRLKVLELATGRIRTIADASRARGGTWNQAGLILFAPDVDSGILSVPATGGRPTAVTDLAGAPSHRFPCFLPDGRHFIYLVLREDRDQSEVWWGRVGGTETGRLLVASSNALYAEPGYLVFARGASLLVQPFDASALRLVGPPVVVAESVGTYREEGPTGLGAFSASRSGVMVTTDVLRQLLRFAWFDRSGRQLNAFGSPGDYTAFDVSPDAARLAAVREDARKRSSDIVTIDVRSGVQVQVTDDPWPDAGVAWAPNGTRLAFASLRNEVWTAFVRDTARGDDEREVGPCGSLEGWLADGRSLLCERRGDRGAALWSVPVSTDESRSLGVTVSEESQSRVSPDGQWLAYTADDDAAQREVRLTRLPAAAASKPFSFGPGTSPRWRRDGREMFYLSGRQLVGVVFDGRGPVGRPVHLFEAPLPGRDNLADFPIQFGVAPDGERFLFAVPAESVQSTSVHVMPRWLDRLAASAAAPPGVGRNGLAR